MRPHLNAQEIREEITALIADKVGVKPESLQPDADIEKDLGCTGDDFFELMESYSKRFSVDMSDFLWYFHTSEEGNNLGASFFRSPDQRVRRIPVTIDLLVNAALDHKWSVLYPQHRIPRQRWDLRINMVFGLVVIIWAMISLVRHCL